MKGVVMTRPTSIVGGVAGASRPILEDRSWRPLRRRDAFADHSIERFALPETLDDAEGIEVCEPPSLIQES